LKRKIERILALLLTAIILAVTVEKVETIWLANLDDQHIRVQVKPEYLPNDPNWTCQWGPRKIEADWAWNATLGNSSILVAVVDSGIDYTHPDLAANYVGLGYDWAYNDSDPMDDNNHGTRVAGIIAAEINNGIGIAGLAQVKVMAEKIWDKEGISYLDWLANGIKHATNQGAQIISMSWSVEYNYSLLYDAVKYAYEKNVLLVAAAGNEENDTKRYPAAYDEVIAVTATDRDDNPAWFSNFGDWVELAAPGVDIYSTIRGPSYDYWSGTSFACPHVSGLAALVWSEFPNATRDWIRTRLRETADDLGNPGFDIYYGYGRINARKAINGTSPAINYTLTITTTVGGTTNPLPGNYTYTEGQNVTVEAIPDIGYRLDYWELDEVTVGSANPYSVLMDKNHTLQTVFAPINYTLVIATTINGTTNPVPGSYNYTAGTIVNVTAIPDTNCYLQYWELDTLNIGAVINPMNVTMDTNHTLRAVFSVGIHDIAVTDVRPFKTVIGQSYSLDINVTIGNQGNFAETFNVSVYANTTPITAFTNITLTSQNSIFIVFAWNTTGFAKGNHTVSAYAWPVPDETDILDNNFTDGLVCVAMFGDITGSNGWPDGVVDMRDIRMVAKLFGIEYPDPRYNPNCDIDNNLTIDMKDIRTVAKQFGKEDP